MKIDVKVKNLGKIKEAKFKVRPMTVITGSNGTGKSFFTKSLYSILNVVNKNVYYEAISKTIRQLQLQLSSFFGTVSYSGTNESIKKKIIESSLIALQNELDEASSWKINDFLVFTESKLADAKKIQHQYSSYLNGLKNKPAKIKSVASISTTINKTFSQLVSQLTGGSDYYTNLIIKHIENEIKDNFQISSLNELISFGESTVEISVDDLLNIKFSEKFSEQTIALSLGADFIDEVAGLSSVVFFESPAYWKVRDALKMAKEKEFRQLGMLEIFRKNIGDILIGVPKYFYDLDDTLKIKTKTSGDFEEVSNSLEKALGGEFIFEGDNLSFRDNQTGREISKHLVSFGMTNLGMIHALLKHNIITAGSFVFIDEPETNLHPDWQLILMNALLSLAERGVNIVITTHSTDILKSLEVGLKKRKIDDVNEFLSVHFVDLDGYLLKFDSDAVDVQLTEAISLLNSTYSDLYFSVL
jgi:predicted ATP-dependent endonuclease of OLD family